MIYSMEKWTLTKHDPRDDQIRIINDILSAINEGYKNIILEAGTGTGKSAIATTISNYVENSYIITMTNQLLQQYLRDFDYMVEEIKGRSNYHCNYGSTCEECNIKEQNKKLYQEYVEALKTWRNNPDRYEKPLKPKKIQKCKDCPYSQALKLAQTNNNVITNYDFLHYAGNYAGILPDRELIIFDESHNFEKKVMQLIVKSLNRKVIYTEYQFDIFDAITENKMTLKEIQQPSYWINVCNKIISIEQGKLNNYITELEKDLLPINPTPQDMELVEKVIDEDDNVQEYKKTIGKYDNLIKILKEEDWIIEMPTKKQILHDETYYSNTKDKGLAVEFKPLTINEYTDTLLHFGKIRLFMTGTLGDKDMFCKWVGIDPDETYYIYQKSPFPIENRPIIREYVGSMSGRDKNTKTPNWKNEDALLKIHDILEEHKGEKGVIHVSSNAQAWWIVDELRQYCHRYFKIAYGKKREEAIEQFEDDDGSMVLVGAGLKDGVDFKGDKCRFQILFKVPFPSLAGTQVNIRKRYDPVWYIYQTVMPLMQAYGRGIRDVGDYCTMYVLDSDFDRLLNQYPFLFNEYFLEAVEGLVLKQPKKRRVKRVRRMEAK